MDSLERKRELDTSLRRVISLLDSVDDDEIPDLLGDGILDNFLLAVANPPVVSGRDTPYKDGVMFVQGQERFSDSLGSTKRAR